MKRKKIYRKDVLEEEKAKKILIELYKAGHGLADYTVERVLGKDSVREEREEIIQEAFVALAEDVEKLERMSLEKKLQYMSTIVWKTAVEKGGD